MRVRTQVPTMPQYSTISDHTKNPLGNATRMAHNLGLHLDSSKWTTTASVSEEEAEARKVTWWGCYVVDK
jgi:hypothetical protein